MNNDIKPHVKNTAFAVLVFVVRIKLGENMLKVFEAFAGYGSQRMALRNCGIPFEVVGVSEIDEAVIVSYASIHTDFLKVRELPIGVSEEEMRISLMKQNVPLDYRTFENRAIRLRGQRLKDIYLANKLIKNYGDIRFIVPEKLPDFDFFTYSFPCQDISVSGYQKGLAQDSGTRSSLLWECCKIIEAKKPKYLMMENVKNLVGRNHRANFERFLVYLESLGYSNKWQVLNARDYGIPQNRERVFCISILGENDFEFPKPVELKLSMFDLLEKDVALKYELSSAQYSDKPIENDVCYCLDSNYWKGTFLCDFLEKRRRQLVTSRKVAENKYTARRLTPRETWRLMGVSDDDFEKAATLVSATSLYKQSGNSIVVPVMEHIFRNLFLKDCTTMTDKEIIIDLFRRNVKGKIPDISGRNRHHDGREGNWLEEQFGKHPDADNHADILGYELKNQTTSKTTFGDWSANRYIFKTGPYVDCFKIPQRGTRQDVFCQIFGKPNANKGGRYSWSGSPCPKLGDYNDYGQKLIIEPNNDIVAIYSFSKDKRANKFTIVPEILHKENLEIARWFGEISPSKRISDKCLKEKLEDKFNDKGWFTCKKDAQGRYCKICFGEPMSFDNWIGLVKQGIVFLDSGMYVGNKRPYSQWRANNNYWDSLIVETYE